MTATVVTLGECLISLVATEPGPLAEAGTFERHIAGAEANVAVGLARLGHPVAYIGRVGSDGFGVAIVRRLRAEGVDVRHLTVDAAATGLMLRERRVLGPAQVVYARTGSAGSRLSPDDIDRAADDGLFADARWLHLTGITPALSTTARDAIMRAVGLADEAGLTISLDVNLRRRLWSDEAAAPIVRSLAEQAHVVLGSPEELAVVTRADAADPAALARAVLTLGPSIAVVKLGADGALGVMEGSAPISVPAVPVLSVVDPVGAGDAFSAGFIAARLAGGDLLTSLRTGNACGAAAVAAMGDLTGLPDTVELERLLGTAGPDVLR